MAQGPGRAAEADSPRTQMAAEFERKAPAIGDSLPDLKALDADGRELRLRSLRGKHTVLVFGCLT